MVLGENGIISRSKQAVNEYQKASENETLGMNEAQRWLEEQMGIGNGGANPSPTLPDGWNGSKVSVYEDDLGNEVPIPDGFTLSGNTNEDSVQEGVVIKSNVDQSEFVWIPVPDGVLDRVQWQKILGAYLDYQDEVNTDLEQSILTYKGFYVARFEASYYNVGQAKSVKSIANRVGVAITLTDGLLWNIVTWTDANNIANSYAIQIGNTAITSTLLTGGMWDEMCKYIEQAGYNVNTDSRAWGNYLNDAFSGTTGLGNTGQWNETKARNIYDVAGNLWEWTKEKYTSGRALRGGGGYDGGSSEPASVRNNDIESYGDFSIGFRVGLYISI